MILTKTYYKTQNSEVLVIVQIFKTRKYYLEGYKHEFFIFIDYHNLC